MSGQMQEANVVQEPERSLEMEGRVLVPKPDPNKKRDPELEDAINKAVNMGLARGEASNMTLANLTNFIEEEQEHKTQRQDELLVQEWEQEDDSEEQQATLEAQRIEDEETIAREEQQERENELTLHQAMEEQAEEAELAEYYERMFAPKPVSGFGAGPLTQARTEQEEADVLQRIDSLAQDGAGTFQGLQEQLDEAMNLGLLDSTGAKQLLARWLEHRADQNPGVESTNNGPRFLPSENT